MGPVYRHTNLVARDWRRLVAFYVEVFACTPVGSERDFGEGNILELQRWTGV